MFELIIDKALVLSTLIPTSRDHRPHHQYALFKRPHSSQLQLQLIALQDRMEPQPNPPLSFTRDESLTPFDITAEDFLSSALSTTRSQEAL